MLIQNAEIQGEFDLINGLLFEEMEREVPTADFIIDNLLEYLNYLNERYYKHDCANRPGWVNEYINLPKEDLIW